MKLKILVSIHPSSHWKGNYVYLDFCLCVCMLNISDQANLLKIHWASVLEVGYFLILIFILRHCALVLDNTDKYIHALMLCLCSSFSGGYECDEKSWIKIGKKEKLWMVSMTHLQKYLVTCHEIVRERKKHHKNSASCWELWYLQWEYWYKDWLSQTDK